MRYYYGLSIEEMRYKYKRDFKDLPTPVCEANMFLKWIEEYPVHIESDDLLAGWYGFKSQEELDAVYRPHLEGDSADEFYEIKDIDIRNRMANHGHIPGFYDSSHHELDYKAILTRGTNAYIEDVENELKNANNTVEKNDFLHAMKKALEGSRLLSGRFADLAEALKKNAKSPGEFERLDRIEKACRKVPMKAPDDLFEAMQAIMTLRTLACISYLSWISVSIGSMDQFLYPYYLESKKRGMGDDEVVDLFVNFFRLIDNYEGKDCVISVGGVDENGNDSTNELSYLIIEAEKKSRLSSPLFVARINENTPKELMHELVCRELFEIGQPSFYSEEKCLEAVAARGIPLSKSKGFQINSCMTMVLPGEEAVHAWGCKVNTHLPLELALNGGKPLVGELGFDLSTQPKTEYNCIEEVFLQYESYLKDLLDIAMNWSKNHISDMSSRFPNPWLSAFTGDCIKHGKDRWNGGAVYQNMVMEMMGFANTADAFTAINKLVFEDKKYTINQLICAAKANYEGFDEIYSDLISCEKYGMNTDTADKNAVKVLDIAARVCENMRTDNIRYLPSLHTLWEDVQWGLKRPAFLDGRKAGEPVNKNAGPTTLARKAGCTSVAISAGKIDQKRYSGGQALDVHIGVRNMDSFEKRDKIAAYIQTYFDMGGLQLQVNGLSVETLIKAYENPSAYPDLLVRIGGHSRYFNEFSNHMKLKFIDRFKIEEGAN